jgi:hypothetical protein
MSRESVIVFSSGPPQPPPQGNAKHCRQFSNPRNAGRKRNFDTKGIRELASALRAAGKHITIETAATIPPNGIACDLASLSPKLSNSTPDHRLPEVWQQKHELLRRQPAIIG